MPRFIKLIDEQDIARRVGELGREIGRHYEGEPLIAVCVLKGAFLFFSDLVRALPPELDLCLDFVRLASYGDRTHGNEKVEFKKDLETDIEGKHVLVVEDIVDTGRSMDYFLKVLALRRPKSVRICALIDKSERREVELTVDFVGFALDKGFVVGYGLDYAEKYRGLPSVYDLILDAQSPDDQSPEK